MPLRPPPSHTRRCQDPLGEDPLARLVVEVHDPCRHPVPAELRGAGAPGITHLVAKVVVAGELVKAAARARGFFGSTSRPWTLRSTTRLKPWMSDATIGTPAAIASSSTIPKDSCPVFGAQKMSDDAK